MVGIKSHLFFRNTIGHFLFYPECHLTLEQALLEIAIRESTVNAYFGQYTVKDPIETQIALGEIVLAKYKAMQQFGIHIELAQEQLPILDVAIDKLETLTPWEFYSN